MLNTTKFKNFCDQNGLNKNERIFAAKIWMAAEQAAFNETPTPYLLRNTSDTVHHALGENLSQQDLQFMKSVNEKALRLMDKYNEEMRTVIKQLWEKADRDDPSTSEAFFHLNQVKTVRRKIKVQAAKLASIQRKIKKLLAY